MGLNDSVHESQSQAVSGGVLAFHKAFEGARAYVGREAGTIIFHDKLSRTVVCAQTDSNLAGPRQVHQFVFQKIADYAVDEGRICVNYNVLGKVYAQFVATLSDGRLVQVYELHYHS